MLLPRLSVIKQRNTRNSAFSSLAEVIEPQAPVAAEPSIVPEPQPVVNAQPSTAPASTPPKQEQAPEPTPAPPAAADSEDSE